MSPLSQIGQALFHPRMALGALMTLLLLLLLLDHSARVNAQGQGNLGNVTSFIVANNTTAVPIRSGAGGVNNVDVFNIGASSAWLKLYDATAVTCGTGTPKARYLIPSSSTSNGAGALPFNPATDRYQTGIVACVTVNIGDADTTAPAASTFAVNIHWQ